MLATTLIHQLVTLDKQTLYSTTTTIDNTPQQLAQVFDWVANTLKHTGEFSTGTTAPQIPVLVPFLSLVSKSLYTNRALKDQIIREPFTFVENLLLLYPVASHLTHGHAVLHFLNSVMLQLFAHILHTKHLLYSMYSKETEQGIRRVPPREQSKLRRRDSFVIWNCWFS